MQISDAILQSEDFISLLHRTLWISEFILFHVQDIAKRFFSITSECRIENVVENYFLWNKRNNPKRGSLVV